MNKQVIIIGSGPSGIAAATKLLDSGFTNVTVLEAEDRMGGRINTIPYGANVLDMGAEWCHGEEQNPVYEMAKDKNVLEPTAFEYYNAATIQSNGERIPQELATRLIQLAEKILKESKEEMKTYKGSLGNFFMEQYNQLLLDPKYDDIDKSIRRQFAQFYEKIENSLEASETWYETSVISSLSYSDCEGNFNLTWKDKGYKTVFDLLQKKIPENNNSLDIKPHLQLNKEVKKISYGNTDGKPPVRVECADGSVYTADHVICTVSLGVLKHNHYSLFDPILPPKKIDAIDGLHMGVLDKVFLEWDKPFWSEADKNGFAFCWRPDEIKVIREAGHDWIEGISAFTPIDYQPNILCGWVTGARARHMEQLSDEEVKEGAMKLLRMFLKTYDVPDPISIKRSTWHTNPHFRGSYSTVILKSDGYEVNNDDLAKPLYNSDGKPVVQFAGEATNLRHYATVHGAIETGWREAKTIIDLYTEAHA